MNEHAEPSIGTTVDSRDNEPVSPTTLTEVPVDDPHHSRNIRKAAILTASLGIVHAVLLITATLMIRLNAPRVYASDQEFIDFYSDPDQRKIVVIAGLYLVPFAGIAFIWFFVALRMWVTGSVRRENILLSNVQLVSGIIYTTLLFAAGASMSVLAASIEFSSSPIDAQLAREFPQLGASLLLVFSMRMAAMFVLTTANIGRTAKILPPWFVAVSFLVAAGLLLSASVSALLILVFPGWVMTFSFILLNRARKIPRDLTMNGRASLAEKKSAFESMQS